MYAMQKSFKYRNSVAKVFCEVRKIHNIKLKWFHIKINNRILVTSSVLRDMGVVANNL